MDNNENNEVIGDAIDETQETENTASEETTTQEPPKEPETRLEQSAKTAPKADDMQQRHGESVSQWRARLDSYKAKK